MEIITLETPSLGDRSYMVHDGEVGLVVDPQRDIDRVLDAAGSAGVEITHVAETHLHNDYVSGGLALARRTGAVLLHAAAESVSFDHRPVAGGDSFRVGGLAVEVVHTPGHTHHHLSFVVRHGDEPPAAFTGGSLLHGTVGRTDLISSDETDELTRAQHDSVRRLAASLPDDAKVLPTHGFGSFCASASTDEESDGTLGREREINLALTIDDADEFVDRLVAGLTAHPAYYAHMGPLNRAGAFAPDLSAPTPVDPAELARRIHLGEWVVDLRDRRAFAAEHLSGSIGVELADPFATYLGWLIPWGTSITLLAEEASQVEEAQRQLVRIGIDRPAGRSLGEGPSSWAPGHDTRSYEVADFAGVAAREGGVVLDVRRPDERDQARVSNSIHVPLDELLDRLDELPDERLWVHSASGFRASIAAGLLDRAGRDVVLVDEEFGAASSAGLVES